MCYVLCVCVMKHVGQDELRMSLQFTLQLWDSLRLPSGWLNPPHPPTGLDSSWLATNVHRACYAKKISFEDWTQVNWFIICRLYKYRYVLTYLFGHVVSFNGKKSRFTFFVVSSTHFLSRCTSYKFGCALEALGFNTFKSTVHITVAVWKS